MNTVYLVLYSLILYFSHIQWYGAGFAPARVTTYLLFSMSVDRSMSTLAEWRLPRHNTWYLL